MKQYLLPCQCGEQVAVDAGQAGLQVDCECGARLDVPTMRGLRDLEPAEAEADNEEEGAQSSWKPHHGVFFLGALVTLLGVGSLVIVYPQRPRVVVHSEFVRETNEHMTLTQSWMVWQDMRSNGMNTALLSESPEFQAQQQFHRVKLALAMVATFVGVALLIGGSYLVPRGSQTPQTPARKTPAE